MNEFVNAITKLGKFTKDDLRAITKIVTKKSVAVGDEVLEAGEVCDTIYFLESGALGRSGRNNEGTLVVQDLFISGDWVFDHKSFTARQPAAYPIKAQTASQLLGLEINDVHELIASSPAFIQLGSLLQLGSARQEFFEQYPAPEDRYRYVLEHRPELLQLFPLKFIASYLQMTPETLSRVRKKLSQG